MAAGLINQCYAENILSNILLKIQDNPEKRGKVVDSVNNNGSGLHLSSIVLGIVYETLHYGKPKEIMQSFNETVCAEVGIPSIKFDTKKDYSFDLSFRNTYHYLAILLKEYEFH